MFFLISTPKTENNVVFPIFSNWNFQPECEFYLYIKIRHGEKLKTTCITSDQHGAGGAALDTLDDQ